MTDTIDPMSAWLKGQHDLMKQFTNWSGATDQYLAVSRALWDLFANTATASDPAAKARAFSEGLTKMQQGLQPAWLANLNGGAFGFMPFNAWSAMGASNPMSSLGPWFDAFQRGITSFEWPALGLTRERQEAAQGVARIASQYWQAQTRLAMQWAEVLRDALAILGERMSTRFVQGERLATPRQLYDLWIESAEAAFAKMAHSPEYAHTQSELTNALSALRTEQRKIVESFAKELDLPTRDELNSVHKRLKQLKGEVRALEAVLERGQRAARTAPSAEKRTRTTRSN